MARKCCNSCAPTVTLLARPAQAQTGKPHPFASFSETKLYDDDFLQRLQDGYSSIDRFMPTFRFNREDAEGVISYMKL
jgi:hypothetical protein